MSSQAPLTRLKNHIQDLGDPELQEIGKELERAWRHLENQCYTLEAELKSLKQQALSTQELTYEEPAYWKIQGKKREGPFCQVCYDTTDKRVRLHSDAESGWECKVCKTQYSDESRSPFRYNPPF